MYGSFNIENKDIYDVDVDDIGRIVHSTKGDPEPCR